MFGDRSVSFGGPDSPVVMITSFWTLQQFRSVSSDVPNTPVIVITYFWQTKLSSDSDLFLLAGQTLHCLRPVFYSGPYSLVISSL